MDHLTFENRYQTYRQAVEAYLNRLFASRPHWADLYEAMRYSLRFDILNGDTRYEVEINAFGKVTGLESNQGGYGSYSHWE